MTTANTDLISLNDQNSTDFEIIVAELNSSRAINPFDISSIITDLEIYEYINSPTITGSIIIADVERVIERFDIQGAETLTLEIQRSTTSANSIRKVFVIDSIVKIARGNETSQVVQLHFTEDIGFKSSLYNVNKAYSGDPGKIISTIAKDYFNKDVISSVREDVADAMQVIIPNLDPIESMQWVRNRTTTSEGYPFFLFTNFATDKIFLLDLGTIISQIPLNEKHPYMFSQSNATTDDPNRMMNIHEYTITNHEDMYSLIKSGYIGASHSFYDITTATYANKKFSVHKDVYDKTAKLNARQNRPVISYDHIIDDVPVSEYNSRQLFNTYASKNFAGKKAYTEESTEEGHARKTASLVMGSLLAKNPIEIVVDGREFISGGESKTIGNIIKVIFKSTDHGHQGQNIDRKLSGDYIIMAARHAFTKEKCRTKLAISKIANYNSDIYTQGSDE